MAYYFYIVISANFGVSAKCDTHTFLPDGCQTRPRAEIKDEEF